MRASSIRNKPDQMQIGFFGVRRRFPRTEERKAAVWPIDARKILIYDKAGAEIVCRRNFPSPQPDFNPKPSKWFRIFAAYFSRFGVLAAMTALPFSRNAETVRMSNTRIGHESD